MYRSYLTICPSLLIRMVWYRVLRIYAKFMFCSTKNLTGFNWHFLTEALYGTLYFSSARYLCNRPACEILEREKYSNTIYLQFFNGVTSLTTQTFHSYLVPRQTLWNFRSTVKKQQHTATQRKRRRIFVGYSLFVLIFRFLKISVFPFIKDMSLIISSNL